MKLIIGLTLGFVIGFVASVFSLPSPSPPVLEGAGLVFSMSLGYVGMDKFMKGRVATKTSPAPVSSVDSEVES